MAIAQLNLKCTRPSVVAILNENDYFSRHTVNAVMLKFASMAVCSCSSSLLLYRAWQMCEWSNVHRSMKSFKRGDCGSLSHSSTSPIAASQVVSWYMPILQSFNTANSHNHNVITHVKVLLKFFWCVILSHGNSSKIIRCKNFRTQNFQIYYSVYIIATVYYRVSDLWTSELWPERLTK